jgi:hypothetical protein
MPQTYYDSEAPMTETKPDNPTTRKNWDAYLQSESVAPPDYMEGVDDLPIQERPVLSDRPRIR